jgi:crotonobetaine/carnitine-CoA ligase
MAQLTTERLAAQLRADGSIRGLLERQVARFADKPLLRCDGEDFTYADVDARANAVANALHDCGLRSGSRVAMLMENSPDWIAVWLGAAKLGAVAVTLNTAHKGEGLRYLLDHSRADALVIDAELAPRVAALSGIRTPKAVFVRDGDEAAALDAAAPIQQLFSGSTTSPGRVPLTPASPCSILYTSGTTGPPKGCLLPNGQYLAAAHLHAANCGYGEQTTLYTCLPLFHINAQNYSLLSALAAGGTLALDAKFSASRFWERVIATEATAFNFIGAMALALWNQPPRAIERSHRARIAFGVPIPLSLWPEWEARFNCQVIYAYGMTENALPAMFPSEDLPAAPHVRGAAGKASLTSEVMIVDDDDFPVPPGTIGEILTRPKIPWTMMTEYVDRPDATREAFRNAWFHTGDLGYLDEQGFLFFVDRKRDALRRRGEMVSSWEVETLVSKFPGVSECAVIGVPSRMTEDDILVAVVCEVTPIDPAELIRYCEENTARFQVPRYVRIVAALPRTQTQRVEKYRLREEGVTPDTFDVAATLARTES